MRCKLIIIYCTLFTSIILSFGYDEVCAENDVNNFSKYNANIQYSGQFVSNLIYLKPSSKGTWTQGLNGTFPANVACPDGLNQLNKEGYYSGIIYGNGACNKAENEPTLYAVGNRLNFGSDISYPHPRR
jgi:hypothetical protein